MAVFSKEMPWFMHLVTPSCEAPDVLPYVPNILVIKATLPENVGIVVKPWTQVEGQARGIYTGHGRRLFLEDDGELLVFMSVKERQSQCSTIQALGGPHQTAVASRYAGHWRRLYSETTCEWMITEMFEKDTHRHPIKTPGVCTSEEARHREVDQGAITISEYSVLEKPMARGSMTRVSGITPGRGRQWSSITRVQPPPLRLELAEPPRVKQRHCFTRLNVIEGGRLSSTAPCLQAHAIYGCLPGAACPDYRQYCGVTWDVAKYNDEVARCTWKSQCFPGNGLFRLLLQNDSAIICGCSAPVRVY